MTHQQNVEYAVYAFHYPLTHKDTAPAWERKALTASRHEAFKKAEGLHKSRAYYSVEVKKKMYDSSKRRSVDKTLKIFYSRPKRWRPDAIMALCGVGVLFLVAALAVVSIL